MAGKILTGTASWTDPGFVADWYPRKVRAADRLRWYSEHFPLVEVNSTFYRVPDARLIRRWCEETPEGFVFDVKLHRLLSRHSTRLEMLPTSLRSKAKVSKGRVELTPQLEKAMARLFVKNLEPFQDAEKLGALLLQLSPAFSPRKNQLEDLDSLLGELEGYKVAIELRNRYWAVPERISETERFFKKRRVAFVMVDAPEDTHFTVMPNLNLVTDKRLAYLRAHGRNAQAYVRGGTVATRFDYVYTKAELNEIADRAVEAAEQAEEVHVIYNNNVSNYAPRAAAAFQEIIRRKHPEAAELPYQELAHA